MIEKIIKIKMLLMDVDGVLTDGSIILGNNGIELKIFNVQDGMGIDLAKRAGLLVGIITGRVSEAVARRAKELNMDEISQGSYNKLEPYENIKLKYNLSDNEIAYIGDDILDISILKKCGLKITVTNGREEVKRICDYVTKASGGNGAVRETVELILKGKGIWEKLIKELI
jgi:3-deoxy-D-manno-octulosonate 8-phosphate phosphatase (KDO 8-P phosphatase)